MGRRFSLEIPGDDTWGFLNPKGKGQGGGKTELNYGKGEAAYVENIHLLNNGGSKTQNENCHSNCGGT